MPSKFGTTLNNYCNDNNILYRCLIDGTVETQEQFNNQIVWYTGQADSEGMAIIGTKPVEITWPIIKAEMDKT